MGWQKCSSIRRSYLATIIIHSILFLPTSITSHLLQTGHASLSERGLFAFMPLTIKEFHYAISQPFRTN